MSETNAIINPTMPREFLDDVVSIKLAEVETALQEKRDELEKAIKEQEKVCEKATEALAEACKADAEEQAGTRLAAIVKAFNDADMFPTMEYRLGSAYGTVKAEEEEYGVPVEIVISQDPRAAKIARGGLPLTTSHRVKSTGGMHVIAATTALVKITDKTRAAQAVVNTENEKKTKMVDQLATLNKYLDNMSTSERKVRAAVARNHLNMSEEGKKALQFLNTLGITETISKQAVGLLEEGKQ